MDIPNDLHTEIKEYCRLNNIVDLNAFMVRMLKQGYTTEKYGSTPLKIDVNPEKEVIVEKIVEVPVEVIKEIEKIVEIPVEVIKEVIKEVFVEKEIYITDDEQVNELTKRIKELENTPPKIIEIEKQVPFEVIKEIVVEKIIEVDSPKKIKKLEQQVENLKIELELEKNRKLEPKKTDIPQKSFLNNAINWVSKSEREKKDLYGE